MNNDDYYVNELDDDFKQQLTKHSRQSNRSPFKQHKKLTPEYKESVMKLDESIDNLLSYNLFGEKKKVKKLKKYKALGFHSAQEYYGWLQSNGLQIYSYDTELSNSTNSLDAEIAAVLSRYKLD